ncbi:RloB family protein [Microbacterium wangruii]|uniref:RloB family protein n=1 Tax=Microbacterium wangruii TaxID=3049073 RepID=UPI00256F26D6|nr:RloB family protein [Microbacterium sp. zg-Y1211]MDL5487133.1 RloB family protein [Microbacterium sp. zg-Y1211]
MAGGRPRNPGRGKAHRAPRTTFLVVCGGRETEIQYVDYLKNHLHLQAVTVKRRGSGETPEKLVKQASLDSDSFDHVWVLCDVDNFQRQIVTADRMASRGGVNLAASNPCFEVWIMWHKEKGFSPGLGIREAQDRASSLGLTTGKHKKDLKIDELMGRYSAARDNAQHARELHARSGLALPENVPASDVDLLVNAILSAEGCGPDRL